MASQKLRWLVTSSILFLAMFTAEALAANPGRSAPPKIMLWSWFAEDDFRFVDNDDIGVAYLALSLRFEGADQVIPAPRQVPIQIPSATYKMAVIRFNYNSWDKLHLPSFSQKQRELAAKMVAEIAAFAHAPAVQIDFDAPRSSWPFYRQLLSDVRARLGPDVFLSITALVSWCDTAQSWLDGMPVDEIVPMAFYMGQATPAITTMLQRGGQFAFPGCRASIGVQLPPKPMPRRSDNRGTAPSEATTQPGGQQTTSSATQWFDPNAFTLTPGQEGQKADVNVRNPALFQRQPDFVRPRSAQRAYFFAVSQTWSADALKTAREDILP